MAKPPEFQNPAMILRMLVFAFAFLLVLLSIFIAPGAGREGGPVYLFIGIGGVSLVAGLVYAQSSLGSVARVDSAGELPKVADFQQKMLIALALIELCALLGLFMSGDVTTARIMAGAAIASIIIGVFPHVERYCRAISGQ